MYRSKIDVWLVLFVFGVCLLFSMPLLFIQFSWVGFIMISMTILFLLDLFFNTRYIVADTVLYVRCGIFLKSTYHIELITEILDTKSIMNAPALSLDRIKIVFKDKGELIISPVRKSYFIRTLTTINTEIRIT